MKSSIYLFFILLFFTLPAFAQKEDCRLKPEELKPLIKRFNPYFSNHTWNAQSQIEMARIGDSRLVMITQDGCIRHHITFNLIIDPKAVNLSREFWLNEVRMLMHHVFWEQPEYDSFGPEFEAAFADKFSIYGLNDPFNFPIGMRNFICELRYDPQKGGKVTIEMVVFIFKEKVETKRLASPGEKDDGWLGVEKKP
ncbi:MAG: hypothetical protein R3C61_18155 [Bacteroidia bacterium]